jgi:hypothetical protein
MPPSRKSSLKPLVEQVGKRAGPDPGPAGLDYQVLELSAGEALGAVHVLVSHRCRRVSGSMPW